MTPMKDHFRPVRPRWVTSRIPVPMWLILSTTRWRRRSGGRPFAKRTAAWNRALVLTPRTCMRDWPRAGRGLPRGTAGGHGAR